MTPCCLIADVATSAWSAFVGSLRQSRVIFKARTSGYSSDVFRIDVETFSRISHLGIDTLRVRIASAVVSFALVYVAADLFLLSGHFDADTLHKRPDVTLRALIAPVPGVEIDATHSGVARVRQLAFVHVEAGCAIAYVSSWARTTPVSYL